ncbi:hypothetical protein MJO28_011197 [Puccinia striiformis f. sp. tritici]|uniref:Uncharacterized protein n=1 Tax=Puccinia striiformis f. sp. tritici TaxID=168172 RepID=A0ACC0E3F5_9BASI|nr:hypothetical protein Pst134EA_020910 [Puccinia striiformis f. sp. tritici]KAH9457007.1 hypothetical protein Pst134EA_020910 [Puccinia striiformis f. sp. tritici]KAI7943669.1 hypothetical protein MJO28_011197 [Puccinia striiformis f. sp. tritici]KAI7946461.1 hypothetical protein MJO29_010988 [Puccinia striiformis f. sp. tritici]
MENINHATLLSLKNLTSPWATSNATSLSWKSTSDGPLPIPAIPTALLVEMCFMFSLMFTQSALLHPKFQDSSTARLTRLSMGPLLVAWWLCYPFRLPILPFEDRSVFPGYLAATMIFKSIESTFSGGPYHMRTLKEVEGVPVWEKDPVESPPKEGDPNLVDLLLWTVVLFTSQRGFRWSWGPAAKGNEMSFLKALQEMVRLQLVFLPCLAFVLHSQDLASYTIDPRKALLSLGVPSFPGLGIFAGVFHSICTMFLISSSLEMLSAIPVLSTYLLYPTLKKTSLPLKVTELINPASFPPQFGSLFELSSLSHFWGKSWHQKLRRPFLFCGGKPAMSLARFLGGSSNIQKACGAMGVFAISGFLHEYPMYAVQREPHPYPRELFKSLPASFLFFFVQSFGVILEPFIIPHIPKRLGGGKLWTASFLLLTAPLFTRDICRPPGMFNRSGPLQQWTWLDIVVPGPLAARAFSLT